MHHFTRSEKPINTFGIPYLPVQAGRLSALFYWQLLPPSTEELHLQEPLKSAATGKADGGDLSTP